MNAIVLAGWQPVGNCMDNRNKALLALNGKTMVEYVVETLREVDDIDRIVVTGSIGELEKKLAGKVHCIIDSKGSIMDHVMDAVKVLGTDEKMLVCSSDIPLITVQSIKTFLSEEENNPSDLCYPIIDKKDCVEKLPEIDKRYMGLKEGSFALTSLFAINPKIADRVFEFIDGLFTIKNSRMKIFRFMGIGYAVKFLLRNLSLTDIERKLSLLSGIRVKLVVCPHPEICADVDKPSDIVVATAYLTK